MRDVKSISADIESLINDAYDRGYDDAIDRADENRHEQAINDIYYGEYDEDVEMRYLETHKPDGLAEVGLEALQQIHRLVHPTGPWGWEYCARCMK